MENKELVGIVAWEIISGSEPFCFTAVKKAKFVDMLFISFPNFSFL